MAGPLALGEAVRLPVGLPLLPRAEQTAGTLAFHRPVSAAHTAMELASRMLPPSE